MSAGLQPCDTFPAEVRRNPTAHRKTAVLGLNLRLAPEFKVDEKCFDFFMGNELRSRSGNSRVTTR